MTATNTDTPDNDSLLAAEYVLRLLEPSEERDFETRLANDRGLMGLVAAWITRFSGLNAEVAPLQPGVHVKRDLQARLFGKEVTRKPSILQRLGLWQVVSFASLAVAAFFAVQSFQVPDSTQVQRGPLYVSEIAANDQSLRLVAVYVSDTGELKVNRTAGAAAEGRALELWAIAEGNAPVSLGVLPESPEAGMAIPPELRGGVGALTLAVSDEPPGGSPTGAPTGDVLAVGRVTEL